VVIPSPSCPGHGGGYYPHPALLRLFRAADGILSAFLGSFIAHTERPYDLIVFEYGCCEAAGDYLERLSTTDSIQQILFLKAKKVD